MVPLKFIGLFTLSHGGNRNQQGGHVPRPFVVVWRHFHVVGQNLEKKPTTLKKKKKHKRFSSSLNVTAVCV